MYSNLLTAKEYNDDDDDYRKKKTKTNLFDNFYAILLLPHKTKKLSDTYLHQLKAKKFTVKTELSPPP
jgi:hypothetical protein